VHPRSRQRRRTSLPAANLGRAMMLALGAGVAAAGTASAEPASYCIDPDHTHPTFDADHLNGLSTWHGLFKRTSGTITLDRAAKSGRVEIDVDVSSIDFGNDKLNEVAASAEAPPIFEAAKYPTAHYSGILRDFIDGAPASVTGSLNLHGVTLPLALTIASFRCIPEHPILKKEVCGADAIGNLNRADYRITVGRPYGFRMEVTLRIQVEAIRCDSVASAGVK
jgi:polyisoprenoid-binding protein YceI